MTDITNIIGNRFRASRLTLASMNTKSEERMLRALDVFERADRERACYQGFRCCVYFIRAGEFVKIGIAGSLRARIRSIQTACPYDLEVIGIVNLEDISEAYRVENALHEQFKTDAVRGEWFHYSDEIKAYVAGLSDYVEQRTGRDA